MKLFKFPFLILLATLFVFNACVDDDFDSPPADGEPANIDANATIADVKAMHTLGGFEEITEDIVISGVVIGDDRSGNFYKVLVIQDTTAGIELRIDETNLFNEYGEGRRVYIKCKGLWLGDYNGVTQLGTSTEDDGRGGLQISRMPSVLLDEIIVKGQWNQHVTPTVKSISQLRAGDVSTLIRIEDVQFSLLTCERTYAIDYVTEGGTRVQNSLNQQLESCASGSIALVRSSGFANFATSMLPTGSGSITAIYTVFGNTKQLTIRDTDDAQMAEPRCGNSGVGGEVLTIKELRDMYNGSAITIAGDFKISGVVISDRLNENLPEKNMVIQDGDYGIAVRFTDAHSYGLGEILEININGVELSQFDGNSVLQLNNVELSRAFTTCNIGTVEPREVSIQEILNNPFDLQSSLIKIREAEISGGLTYGGNKFVTDATNTIAMFTQSYASFNGSVVPSGKLAVTAIVGDFRGTVQIAIRNLNDIEGGTIIEPDAISIAAVRTMFADGGTSVSGSVKITGIVISDFETGHTNGQNLVLQGESGGIVVRFTEFHAFSIGSELTINVSGLELSEFNDLLQINNVPIASVIGNEAGVLPTPRLATVAEVKTNGEAWESTLIKINEVSITGSATFNGVTKVTDATGSLDMFTAGSASFSGNALPGGDVNLTGIITEYQGVRQIAMRSEADVE